MKLAAYQFAVTGSIAQNMQAIEAAVAQAAASQAELLVFPECALTGYPPRDIPNSAAVDLAILERCYDRLLALSAAHRICLVVGTITEDHGVFRNTAMVFTPQGPRRAYHKRALWGWDRDNFVPGDETGILEISGLKVGLRICFEVRFPEYFRELYREHTDLNLLLFYDVSDYDDMERYDMIKAHIRTRAVENVCHTLAVDAIAPYQTAPTALYDRSGCALRELPRNQAGLLVYDLDIAPLDFGEQGRKEISDILISASGFQEVSGL